MSEAFLSTAQISARIQILRGQKVLLDRDLAALYGVETRALNQAVKRNAERFPKDFMFSLSRDEIVRVSQFVTSSRALRFSKRVHAFTEQGVAMLSSVLRSDRAVQVNIAIMRTFVQLRAALARNRELARKFSELEKRVDQHDENIAAIIETIRQLIEPEPKPRREIGFHAPESSSHHGANRRR
jgi:hypothetical protein